MRRILLPLAVLTLVLALFCLPGPAAAASDGITVGTDIAFDDITDFYYQRYRFYAEDEKRFFYHETREGGGWPQTEADITRSGTIELTEEQWSACCDLLNGGTASRREEHLDSGDAGPWLYIYWRGGETEGREFYFDQPGTVLAFEAFCAALAGQNGDHTLTRFFYSLQGDMMPRSWEITLRADEYRIQENEEAPRPFPEAYAAELMQAIADHGI